jgi:DNA helicase-2/ATP-dependent DNA helicase PcrA
MLTPEQNEVVTVTHGHIVVLAGPGSGKTRTVTEKIVYLLDNNIISEPYGLLAITFTTAAANEMRSRLRTKGFRQWDRVFTGTFHSFGRYLLTCYGGDVGTREDFQIIEPEEQKRILGQIASRQGYVSVGELQRAIENLKRRGIYPGTNDERVADGLIKAYREYQQWLKEHNTLDFGDLVALPLRLLQESALARRLFTNFFRYVIVDEFQDTDPQQLELVYLLAQNALGSTIVADDDQSIYRFRGAERQNVYKIENMLGARRVVLGANFRSDQVIVEAANAVIGHEAHRAPKALLATSPNRGHLYKVEFSDVGQEARQVVKWVATLSDQQRIEDLGEIAIIARARWRADSVINQLDHNKIPWFDRSRLKFQDSWETSLGLAILFLACDPDSSDALYQVMESIECGGLAFRLRYEDALDLAREIRGRLKTGLTPVFIAPTTARTILGVADAEGIIRKVAWSDTEADHSLRNLDMMVVDLMNEAKTLNLTLREAVLRLEGGGAIQILTGHGAKGREFNHVFFIGLEDDILPSYQTIGKEEEIAEERRIFYVGLTRARQVAYLTYVTQRATKGGYLQQKQPSRFLSHIPPELLSPIQE